MIQFNPEKIQRKNRELRQKFQILFKKYFRGKEKKGKEKIIKSNIFKY